MAIQSIDNYDNLSDLFSCGARSRLAKMTMILFDCWDLDNNERALLLGLSPGRWTTLARYRKGVAVENRRDLIGRISHLLGIHKSLRIMFPHDRDLAYRWIKTPNHRFDGKQPLEIMINGYEGLLAIRRYLDLELRL